MPTSNQGEKTNRTPLKGKGETGAGEAAPLAEAPLTGVKAERKKLSLTVGGLTVAVSDLKGRFGDLKGKFGELRGKFDELKVKFSSLDRQDLLVLIPGSTVMVMGAILLFYPQFLIVASALLLMLAGAIISFATLKALQLKRKIEKLSKEFEGQILVHRAVQREGYYVLSKDDDKKQILH